MTLKRAFGSTWNPDRYDPLFAAYPSQPGLLDVVEDLLGPDIKAFLVMFIYKPPARSISSIVITRTPYHFPFFGGTTTVSGDRTALDPTDADNGTLCCDSWVTPVGRLAPRPAPEGDRAITGVFGVEGYDDRPDEAALELEPGDSVFFHSRLLHKTGSNLSAERPRRVMTVHYASSRCRPLGEHHKAIGFHLVRGQSYEGCI